MHRDVKQTLLANLCAKGEALLGQRQSIPQGHRVRFIEVQFREMRQVFDQALDLTHYAKSCQRVGRCMRLAIIYGGRWVGGVVLGSTFPNVDVRDRALGLKVFVSGFAARGLRNPWSGKNRDYWSCLQSIVNHARTFVFPEFQGRGLGKEAHRLLLNVGIKLWEKKYNQSVYALDTLCDHSDSGLFLSNGWIHVGETRGFTADYKNSFTLRKKTKPCINNAALRLGSTRWQVWIRMIRPSLKPTNMGQKHLRRR